MLWPNNGKVPFVEYEILTEVIFGKGYGGRNALLVSAIGWLALFCGCLYVFNRLQG